MLNTLIPYSSVSSKLDICVVCQNLTEEHLFTVSSKGRTNRESLCRTTVDKLVTFGTRSPGPGMQGVLAMPTI